MKKHLLILSLILASVAIIIVSCKKENHETNSKREIASEASGDLGNMDEYLVGFRNQLNNAFNSKETIGLDQAQRDLGNLLNFDYGDANYPTNVYQKDTIRLNLPLVEGEVYLKDLGEAYQKAKKEISETFNNVVLPEKSVYAIVCSISKQTRDESDAEIQLVLITRGVNPGLLIKISIDTTDNWHVGYFVKGKCDGTCEDDDHASIIAKVFCNNRPPVNCANGRLYYTNYHGNTFRSFEYPETGSGPSYCGYLLWDGPLYELLNHCIEYPEMQYYYNNFCQIMEDLLPYGSVFTEVDCFVTNFLANYENHYFFVCNYSYAKPNCTDEPIH